MKIYRCLRRTKLSTGFKKKCRGWFVGPMWSCIPTPWILKIHAHRARQKNLTVDFAICWLLNRIGMDRQSRAHLNQSQCATLLSKSALSSWCDWMSTLCTSDNGRLRPLIRACKAATRILIGTKTFILSISTADNGFNFMLWGCVDSWWWFRSFPCINKLIARTPQWFAANVSCWSDIAFCSVAVLLAICLSIWWIRS